MMEPLVWDGYGRSDGSPFDRRRVARPLRVTVHSSSLLDLEPEEQRGLDLLRDLLALEEIEAVETQDGL
jgi:hypothetical protein